MKMYQHIVIVITEKESEKAYEHSKCLQERNLGDEFYIANEGQFQKFLKFLHSTAGNAPKPEVHYLKESPFTSSLPEEKRWEPLQRILVEHRDHSFFTVVLLMENHQEGTAGDSAEKRAEETYYPWERMQ
ncbi:MAG: hypothetical protein V2G52_01445 [bacterium JZ-2024 1]